MQVLNQIAHLFLSEKTQFVLKCLLFIRPRQNLQTFFVLIMTENLQDGFKHGKIC